MALSTASLADTAIFVADTWSEDTWARAPSIFLLHSCAGLQGLGPCQPTGHLWLELACISAMLQGYNLSFPVFCTCNAAQSGCHTQVLQSSLENGLWGEGEREKTVKCFSSTAGLQPLGELSSIPAHCLYFHLSSHRFHTWGFVRAKNWEIQVFGSWRIPPFSLSHMDQLEALTGEKPYYKNRQSYISKENPWPF